MTGIRIAGVGGYLPGPAIDQDGVREFLRRHRDGLSESMQERLLDETGILARHFALDLADETRRESNTSMATAAARRALEAANWRPEEVDLLVVTTVVPDQLMPPTSTLAQEALEIPRCTEIEISANCSAPYKGLAFPVSHLRLGQYQRALLCFSQFVTCVLSPLWINPERMGPDHGFLRWIVSDGAGAIALECGEPDTSLRVWLESTGCGKRSGMSLAFGATQPDFIGAFERGDQHVTQNGRYAMRQGFLLAVEGFERMLRELETSAKSIDHFIPAVSSMQVARKLQLLFAERFGLRPESWRLNLARVGYVGSAGLPLVLDELLQAGELRPGDLVCSVPEESSKWMCAGTIFRWNP